MTEPALQVAQLPLGAYQTNCYLACLEGRTDAVVIDPGDEPDRVQAALAEQGWSVAAILVTHAHFDHIGAVADIAAASGAEVWMPGEEAGELRGLTHAPYEPQHLLRGGEDVAVGGIAFRSFAVPGHSPASIAFAAHGFLFSGDVLFSGSVGRTDLAGGSMPVLLQSISTLLRELPGETVVCPGHGPITTLDVERQTNPFLAELRA